MIPLYVPVLLPIVVAAVCFLVPRRVYHALLLSAQAVQTLFVIELFVRMRRTGPIVEYIGSWPTGIGLALKADDVSGVLMLLTAVIFLCLFVFNTRKQYMNNIFQFLFITLQSVTIALFLSGDVFNVYVLTELGMIMVSILIMYKHDKQALYDGVVFFMVNMVGMSFYLLGIGLLYKTIGTLDIAAIGERVMQIEDPRSVLLPFALLVTGVGVKAAIFPLFSWLPHAHGAHSAPSIVSAALSGIQVKTGVYLLIRFNAMFAPVFDTGPFFVVIGFVTAVVGFTAALAEDDVKLLLAYSTVSQIGLIVFGLNAGTETAYWGGLLHIVNHALFKALLFITAGLIVKKYGTRKIADIRGVFLRMPVVAVASIMAVFGIAGVPFFNGSISKYLIESGVGGRWGGAALILMNLGTITVFVKFAAVYFGRSDGEKFRPDVFTGGVAVLMGLACLAIGLASPFVIRVLFAQDLAIGGAYEPDKALVFLGTLAVAIAVYHGIARLPAVTAWIRSKKLRFNSIALSITLFFATFASYLYVTAL